MRWILTTSLLKINMELVQIYEEYNSLNKEFIAFLDKVLLSNFEGYSEEEVNNILVNVRDKMENLKVLSDSIEENEDNRDNLRDLKYLVVDTFFLLLDLINFYKHKEIERFKMRAVNYINKRRRAEFFA
ncbi:MAG: hypothetical protein PUE01_12485 [Clostridiaceae bacterium]|nr:hypothetical protein [Clostridiaceae bacterium]